MPATSAGFIPLSAGTGSASSYSAWRTLFDTVAAEPADRIAYLFKSNPTAWNAPAFFYSDFSRSWVLTQDDRHRFLTDLATGANGLTAYFPAVIRALENSPLDAKNKISLLAHLKASVEAGPAKFKKWRRQQVDAALSRQFIAILQYAPKDASGNPPAADVAFVTQASKSCRIDVAAAQKKELEIMRRFETTKNRILSFYSEFGSELDFIWHRATMDSLRGLSKSRVQSPFSEPSGSSAEPGAFDPQASSSRLRSTAFQMPRFDADALAVKPDYRVIPGSSEYSPMNLERELAKLPTPQARQAYLDTLLARLALLEPTLRAERAEQYFSGKREWESDPPEQVRRNLGSWLVGASISAQELASKTTDADARKTLKRISGECRSMEEALRTNWSNNRRYMPDIVKDIWTAYGRVVEDEHWRNYQPTLFGFFEGDPITHPILAPVAKFVERHSHEIVLAGTCIVAIVQPEIGSALFIGMGLNEIDNGIKNGSASQAITGALMCVPGVGRAARFLSSSRVVAGVATATEFASATAMTGLMAKDTLELIRNANSTYWTLSDAVKITTNVAVGAGVPLAAKSTRAAGRSNVKSSTFSFNGETADPYAILSVRKSATLEQIVSARNQMVKDLAKVDPTLESPSVKDGISRINAAFDYLATPLREAAYQKSAQADAQPTSSEAKSARSDSKTVRSSETTPASDAASSQKKKSGSKRKSKSASSVPTPVPVATSAKSASVSQSLESVSNPPATRPRYSPVLSMSLVPGIESIGPVFSDLWGRRNRDSSPQPQPTAIKGEEGADISSPNARTSDQLDLGTSPSSLTNPPNPLSTPYGSSSAFRLAATRQSLESTPVSATSASSLLVDTSDSIQSQMVSILREDILHDYKNVLMYCGSWAEIALISMGRFKISPSRPDLIIAQNELVSCLAAVQKGSLRISDLYVEMVETDDPVRHAQLSAQVESALNTTQSSVDRVIELVKAWSHNVSENDVQDPTSFADSRAHLRSATAHLIHGRIELTRSSGEVDVLNGQPPTIAVNDISRALYRSYVSCERRLSHHLSLQSYYVDPADPSHRIEFNLQDEGLQLPVLHSQFLLRSILHNLSTNILRYGGGDGVLELEVVGERELRLRLSDSGAGLSAEQAAHAFDRHTRLENRVEGSSGVGLWFCRWAAEQMGGTIDLIHSPPIDGQPTTFELVFPLSGEVRVPPSAAPSSLAAVVRSASPHLISRSSPLGSTPASTDLPASAPASASQTLPRGAEVSSDLASEVEALRQRLSQTPDDRHLLTHLAEVESQIPSQEIAASQHARRAISLGDDSLGIWNVLAESEVRNNHFYMAYRAFEHGLEGSRSGPASMRARMNDRLSDWYDQLISQGPRDSAGFGTDILQDAKNINDCVTAAIYYSGLASKANQAKLLRFAVNNWITAIRMAESGADFGRLSSSADLAYLQSELAYEYVKMADLQRAASPAGSERELNNCISARNAYQRAIETDPANQDYRSRLAGLDARIRSLSSVPEPPAPSSSGVSSPSEAVLSSVESASGPRLVPAPAPSSPAPVSAADFLARAKSTLASTQGSQACAQDLREALRLGGTDAEIYLTDIQNERGLNNFYLAMLRARQGLDEATGASPEQLASLQSQFETFYAQLVLHRSDYGMLLWLEPSIEELDRLEAQGIDPPISDGPDLVPSQHPAPDLRNAVSVAILLSTRAEQRLQRADPDGLPPEQARAYSMSDALHAFEYWSDAIERAESLQPGPLAESFGPMARSLPLADLYAQRGACARLLATLDPTNVWSDFTSSDFEHALQLDPGNLRLERMARAASLAPSAPAAPADAVPTPGESGSAPSASVHAAPSAPESRASRSDLSASGLTPSSVSGEGSSPISTGSLPSEGSLPAAPTPTGGLVPTELAQALREDILHDSKNTVVSCRSMAMVLRLECENFEPPLPQPLQADLEEIERLGLGVASSFGEMVQAADPNSRNALQSRVESQIAQSKQLVERALGGMHTYIQAHPDQVAGVDLEEPLALMANSAAEMDRALVEMSSISGRPSPPALYNLSSSIWSGFVGASKRLGDGQLDFSAYRVPHSNSGVHEPLALNDGHTDIPVIYSPLLMRGVFNNLASNANRYGGGGPIRLEVEVNEPDARVRIRFIDSGPGLTAEQAARAFDYGARDENAVAGSTHVGLSFCRRAMEEMGGTIEILHSPPIDGQPTTFQLSLPLQDRSQPSAQTPLSSLDPISIPAEAPLRSPASASVEPLLTPALRAELASLRDVRAVAELCVTGAQWAQSQSLTLSHVPGLGERVQATVSEMYTTSSNLSRYAEALYEPSTRGPLVGVPSGQLQANVYRYSGILAGQLARLANLLSEQDVDHSQVQIVRESGLEMRRLHSDLQSSAPTHSSLEAVSEWDGLSILHQSVSTARSRAPGFIRSWSLWLADPVSLHPVEIDLDQFHSIVPLTCNSSVLTGALCNAYLNLSTSRSQVQTEVILHPDVMQITLTRRPIGAADPGSLTSQPALVRPSSGRLLAAPAGLGWGATQAALASIGGSLAVGPSSWDGQIQVEILLPLSHPIELPHLPSSTPAASPIR